jgi:hypothetical protein
MGRLSWHPMPKKRKIRGENPKRQKQKQNNTKEEACTEEKTEYGGQKGNDTKD